MTDINTYCIPKDASDWSHLVEGAIQCRRITADITVSLLDTHGHLDLYHGVLKMEITPAKQELLFR